MSSRQLIKLSSFINCSQSSEIRMKQRIPEQTISNSCVEQYHQIVCRNTRYANQFNIGSQGIIERNNYNVNFYHLFGSIAISQKPKNQWKILKSQNNYICLGIMDASYKDDNFYIWEQGQRKCIFYFVRIGNVIASGKRTGTQGRKGAQQGQTITMNVESNKISWSVGPQIRATITNDLVADQSIKWVPFLAMRDEGDRIKWS